MSKIAIVTDSNSGITQEEAGDIGAYVVPMPVIIDGETYYEGIDIDRDEFYRRLNEGSDVSTSQPLPGDLFKLWEKVLRNHDEIIYIPMSSSLSRSYETALILSQEFDNKVHVINNQRISVSQRQSVLDALEMTRTYMSGLEIKEALEKDKYNYSIYIAVDTLKYLKKGGRITPTVAAIGSLLKIKPVLQIQGDMLDSFAKARTIKAAKKIMIEQLKKDVFQRFSGNEKDSEVLLQIAHANEDKEAEILMQELQATFPDFPIHMDNLPLSIACHTGPGVLGVGCIKKLKVETVCQEFKIVQSL